jgi:hypothetical protein
MTRLFAATELNAVMPMRAIAILLGLLAAPASAQDSVLLLAPAELRADWAAALQIELAPRGTRVIPGEPPVGESVAERDAEAQRLAQEIGAVAVAHVESETAGLALRLIRGDAAGTRVTPVAREADPRTVALILASLLEEPGPEPAIDEAPPPVAAQPAPVEARETEVPPAARLARPEAEEIPTGWDPGPPAIGDVVKWSGWIGTGGLGIVNDRRFIPGAMIRGGVGLRYGYFEGALLADAGLALDELGNTGADFQPFGRGCVEGGPAFSADRFGFHFGARACIGFMQLRRQFFDDFTRTPTLVDETGALGSVGGYVALSITATRTLRVYIRAEVEYSRIAASMHEGEAIVVLSPFLTVH